MQTGGGGGGGGGGGTNGGGPCGTTEESFGVTVGMLLASSADWFSTTLTTSVVG